MTATEGLAERFESHREHLRAVAYRMLGSVDEAEDAVQMAWLRADRSDLSEVANLGGWLTTVVGRVCLDLLRVRRSRGELPLATLEHPGGPEPEQEAVLAESVGLALLVVLDRLTPAERVAFVLHDLFAVPFEQIAPVVGRTPVASKKLASRARSRVRGSSPEHSRTDLAQHHAVVTAFLTASRDGDLATLLEVLAPDVVRRADRGAVPAHVPTEITGARAVAEETRVFAAHAGIAEVALVDGRPGIIVAPLGRLRVALRVTIASGRITEVDVIGDPARLARLTVSVARAV